MLLENSKFSVTFCTLFADQKPTVSTVVTKCTRLLFALTVLTTDSILDLRHATSDVNLVAKIKMTRKISEGKGDLFEADWARKDGLLVGRAVHFLLQAIIAEGVQTRQKPWVTVRLLAQTTLINGRHSEGVQTFSGWFHINLLWNEPALHTKIASDKTGTNKF